MRGPRAVALVTATLAWLQGAQNARADETSTCMAAHEHGQEVRLANHWVEARRLFLTCAQASCPALVVQDCTQWELELRARIPTVVVSAKRADGSDVDQVLLTIDGGPVGPPLPTAPLPLDPGEHLLRFEHPGWPAAQTVVTLRDGEHDRPVDVRLEPPASPAPPLAEPSRGAPVGAYVATGVGAAAAIASVVFLAVGKVDEHNLAVSQCGQAGTCLGSQVSPIATDYVVSGITAGVAAVAVGLGIWLFLAHKPSPGAAAFAWQQGIAF
jgi:hypothetical protein